MNGDEASTLDYLGFLKSPKLVACVALLSPMMVQNNGRKSLEPPSARSKAVRDR